MFLVALGAYGIFMSMGIAMAVAFLLSLVILILRFNYLPKPIIDRSIVKRMTKFSLGNYILLAFGKEYSYDGFILLKFLSISGILMIINAIGGAILNIKCITFN